MSAPADVTIVGGFLGAGKTTHVVRDLLAGTGAETLVVLNELGDGETEAALFARTEHRLIAGGCVCCERKDDLRQLLRELVGRRRSEPIRHILIETTGLARPESVARLLVEDPLLHHATALREIVVVADAVALRATLAENVEATWQLAAADRVLLSKADLCDAECLADAAALVRSVNPDAELDGPAAACVPALSSPPPDIEAVADRHLAAIETLTLDLPAALSWEVFGAWLTLLLHAHGSRVLRFKGCIDVGAGGPVLLDGVRDVVHPPRHLEDWRAEAGSSRLTFIARGLDTARIERSLGTFERAFGRLTAAD